MILPPEFHNFFGYVEILDSTRNVLADMPV